MKSSGIRSRRLFSATVTPLRTCTHLISRLALTKSPTSRNPVGGATGVQYTRRSADGIDDTFGHPRPIHEPESYGSVDGRVLTNRLADWAWFAICLILWAGDVFGAGTVAASDRLNWPNRMGPSRDGHVAKEDARDLPTQWSEEPPSNIAWKIELEGFGHSSPIVGHGRIWLTSATKDGKQQFVDCIDQVTGKVLHHKLLFENPEPEPLGNEVNTYASPSCVLEDDALYVHFGTYGTARLNPETTDVVWQRRDINCRHFRGPGSSPVVWRDILILTYDGIDQQFLTALNKHTGETLWRTDRTTDYGDLNEDGKPHRDGDMRKAFSTPSVVEVNGRAQVVSVGSRAAFAYDLETGKELWTIRHDDYNASSPPMFFQQHAIINTGTRGSNLLSVRLDDSTRGDVSESHVVWNRDKGNSDLSAPLLIGERVFSMLNNGVIACVNAATGEDVWRDRVEGTFTATPITANGLIYFCNEAGDCYVVKAEDSYELVARNHLAEGMRASPSAADGHLFFRTFSYLYSIGQ